MAEADVLVTEDAPLDIAVDPVDEVTEREPDENVTEREPGGDDPQAVRARKEYRARKAAQEALNRERMERVKVEERLKLLEEQAAKPKAPAERIFTMAEINAAAAEGKIDRATADRYIEEVIFPHKANALLEKREQETRQLEPLQRAQADIQEYLKWKPSLNDTSSQDFARVATKYNELVAMGSPADVRTQRIAVEMVHGDLTTLKRKADIAAAGHQVRTMPTDPGGGGTRTPSATVDITKAPAHMVEVWNKTGLSQAEREREFKYWASRKRA